MTDSIADKKMLSGIRKNIDRRMDIYTDSRQPSGDEIAIAWLITKIDELVEERESQNRE